MKYVTLNNGVQMPILGYGVYQIPDQEECEKCVLDAIEVGYRSIDTAQAYRNEEAVGRAIKKSGIPREEFFVTTKVWISNAGYEKAKASIEDSMRKMQLDYLDLVLIHQPFNDYYGTYRAMEELYKANKIRAIGVSNFYPDRYIDLVQFSEVVPAINQVETHVFNQQVKAQEIMKKYNTQIESWGPFAEGKNNFFTNPTLQEIGTKHNKSAAQVALRFLIQRDVVVIPKTVNKDRMEQNLDVFDFELSSSDMAKIAELDTGESLFFSHYDPDTVEYLTDYGKKGLE
ncbi:aldo/keto reductase [Paenibacillus urinalis]|uniref:Aldo/keto reductase n=1 Tax=Paenibacillus urinalis TaxID=521520 RepID=A0AAX3MW62_9BACL|nr:MULTISPECIES: aldo/keto reductase [Paenibacillus]WDH80647.1 aldo/keto reductase [Paenibacillus urinalis]WDH96700.1 aldo/keto reductase [Paenibacillus urinalis]WDI00343.1 aldo/keto reductase [Paenibacillus urinalis]GAK40854.1 2,5-didehydrogluconate reductase [Paenibacillus sp. TCA20]